jgi:hypothetical protein
MIDASQRRHITVAPVALTGSRSTVPRTVFTVIYGRSDGPATLRGAI